MVINGKILHKSMQILAYNHDGVTYLLTPWSTVLLEKLTGFAASQEIPAFLEPEGSSP